MSKFLDHLGSFTGPSDTVIFRGPLTANVTWDVDRQRALPFAKKYRLEVRFGAQIVARDGWGIDTPMRQVRKLIAEEIYGQVREIKNDLIEMQMKLYNTPDKEAQNMASDINFLLIKIDEATT